jgi:hypothetical protein
MDLTRAIPPTKSGFIATTVAIIVAAVWRKP